MKVSKQWTKEHLSKLTSFSLKKKTENKITFLKEEFVFIDSMEQAQDDNEIQFTITFSHTFNATKNLTKLQGFISIQAISSEDDSKFERTGFENSGRNLQEASDKAS